MIGKVDLTGASRATKRDRAGNRLDAVVACNAALVGDRNIRRGTDLISFSGRRAGIN